MRPKAVDLLNLQHSLVRVWHFVGLPNKNRTNSVCNVWKITINLMIVCWCVGETLDRKGIVFHNPRAKKKLERELLIVKTRSHRIITIVYG